MSAMRDALPQYVALRRALGTKLQEPARTLEHFLGFLKREGSEFITSELALRWAMEPKGVQRATWARRLGMVRQFAAWFSTIDARTEVPPHRLLAARRRRNQPHIFTEQEIGQLMTVAAAWVLYRMVRGVPVMPMARRASLYTIGTMAAYWSFARIAAILG